MSNIIFSRAPVRICDIGGWTDTWFYPKGAVFNICIDLFSHVRIVPINTDKIKIISENLNLRVEIQDIRKIEYNGNLDLLKAAVKMMGIERGINIYIKADVPPGCGTGTSASVSVALIAALARFSSKNLTPSEIAQLARQHNNANVLCIPANFVSLVEARKILLAFLTTKFDGGRHERRIKKINII